MEWVCSLHPPSANWRTADMPFPSAEHDLMNCGLSVWEYVFSDFSDFKAAIFSPAVDFYAKVCYILKASQNNNKSTVEISDYV